MDDTVQSYVTSHCADEGYAGRIDVATGPSGRRRWPEHVKAGIVLESYRDGVSVADVARKHGVSAPQLHAWRRAAREGVLAMPDDDILGWCRLSSKRLEEMAGPCRPTRMKPLSWRLTAFECWFLRCSILIILGELSRR